MPDIPLLRLSFLPRQFSSRSAEPVSSAAAGERCGGAELHQPPLRHLEQAQPGRQTQHGCAEAHAQHAH